MKFAKIFKTIICVLLCISPFTQSRKKNNNPLIMAIGAVAQCGATTAVGQVLTGALCMVGQLALNAAVYKLTGTALPTPTPQFSDMQGLAGGRFMQVSKRRSKKSKRRSKTKDSCESIYNDNKIKELGVYYLNTTTKTDPAAKNKALLEYVAAYNKLEKKSKDALMSCLSEATKKKNIAKEIDTEISKIKA
jgi:hypothetical protein